MSSQDLTLLTRAEIYALGYIAIPTTLERAVGGHQHRIANHGVEILAIGDGPPDANTCDELDRHNVR
jgi:hypothetical protein